MSASAENFFDASLPTFARAVANSIGPAKLADGLFVRDTSGRLRFLSAGIAPSDEERLALDKVLSEQVGPYARRDGAISFMDDVGVRRLFNEPGRIPLQLDGLKVWLLDRRIVGSAWLDSPQQTVEGPPRLVFASLKGGVGRSTALAVTGSDLSRQGKNVLVVDLDLEAPGIGDILLSEDRMPRYGTLDYLVENGIGGISDSMLQDFLGTSPLTNAAGGRVDVVPAFGSNALNNPTNTLAKISRAVLEDIDEDGSSISITSQMCTMLARFVQRGSYDVVLIDTRAGLAEITAPALLGLGASVLLFGTAQRQTVHGYEALFASLKLLAERDKAAGRQAAWRANFKAVYAKAGLSAQGLAEHRDNLYDLFAENLYDEESGEGPFDPNAFSFDIDDESAPHFPLIIPFSQNFLDFDPVVRPDQLNAAFYEHAYQPFLAGVDAMLSSA